jgi:hypothetical protein
MALEVCTKCGWYDGYTHARECDPKGGKLADEFAARFPGIKSTKLGYGHGRLTFQFGKADKNDVHEGSITLDVDTRSASEWGFHWFKTDHATMALVIKGLAAAMAGEDLRAQLDTANARIAVLEDELDAARAHVNDMQDRAV